MHAVALDETLKDVSFFTAGPFTVGAAPHLTGAPHRRTPGSTPPPPAVAAAGGAGGKDSGGVNTGAVMLVMGASGTIYSHEVPPLVSSVSAAAAAAAAVVQTSILTHVLTVPAELKSRMGASLHYSRPCAPRVGRGSAETQQTTRLRGHDTRCLLAPTTTIQVPSL